MWVLRSLNLIQSRQVQQALRALVVVDNMLGKDRAGMVHRERRRGWVDFLDWTCFFFFMHHGLLLFLFFEPLMCSV
jgi:hypothetical protein